MGLNILTLGSSKSYTDEVVKGGGAIKGKNCTIEKIEEVDRKHIVTFKWTLDDGTVKTSQMEVMDGKDGEDGYTPQKDVDYFDGEKGDKGDTGVGIELITKTGSTGIVDNYEILFTDGSVTTYSVVNGANITKLSELENDEEFIKANTINLTNYYLKTEAYNKSQIDELLRNIGAGLSVKIVATLPTEEISGTTIYLINTSGSNYNQYMYIDGSWANLGSTEVDMSSYYNKTQIDNKLEDYVTANRLTNKLDDYVEKSKLSKVGKSNSYNDLDDLPTIPDVSGLKPYVETLQDSVNTAPVSKVVYDAVQDINKALENKLEESDLEPYAKTEDVPQIDDTSTTDTDKVWSAKKINDSLVDIEDDLENKVDKEELDVIPLIYNQNTDILAYALTCPQAKRTLVRIHSANATNNPFGITSDTDFIYEISKVDSANAWIYVKAKDVRTNREFINTRNDVKWLGWVELATMDKVQKGLAYTINSFTCPANSQQVLVQDVTTIGVNWSVGWSAFIMNRNGFVNFNLFGDGNTLYLRNNQSSEVTGKIVLYFNYT